MSNKENHTLIKIICIGNRFITSDSSGPAVYDYLMGKDLPDYIELIDGGIAGLNLLGLIYDSSAVIFVDSVSGFSPGEGNVLLTYKEICDTMVCSPFSHTNGLAYLLKVLPEIYSEEIPEIFLVGIENIHDESIALAAKKCLFLAQTMEETTHAAQ